MGDIVLGYLRVLTYIEISVIPIIRTVVSTVADIADPVIDYIVRERSQRNLPFFLNNLRRMSKTRREPQ